MKCERLVFLVKNWYLKVQEEAMAPARMVAFMEKHISQCEECLADPDVKQEADKIREIVLPPAKAAKPKVARVAKEDVENVENVEDVDDDEEDGETEDEDISETDEDEIEDDDGDDDDDDDDDFDSANIMVDDEI